MNFTFKQFQLLFFLSLICNFNVVSQTKKQYKITSTEASAVIDGKLNDSIWQNLPKATNFTQFTPNIGLQAEDKIKTEVKLFYNKKGIYLAAKLYDEPSLMMNQLTKRDEFGQTDYFTLVLNPNNDAQNDTQFIVFSSGVQADALSTPSLGQDFGWNAVWESAVQLTDFGWQLELLIPYRSLRFPKDDIQTWGVQFKRFFRRERSEYAWNAIDPTKGYEGIYHGELTGIKNLKPPLRLNLYPFTTGLVNQNSNETSTDLKFGMDIKYGVTDNITLDATLIPDFSQARFDDVVLNLGPFEQTFAEQRQFFTEGIDLFTKGNLFFSRRVGSAPTGQINLNESEQLQSRPSKVDLINAAKLSGRLKNGLGIGVFNALTEKTYVNIRDTISGLNRRELVEPLTNYNILVLDQQFNRNSSVSLINTNVSRQGDFRDANVTGALLNLINKSNTYAISAEAKTSQLSDTNQPKSGYSATAEVAKVGGNFRFALGQDYADKKFDINDLGLLLRNNYNNTYAEVSYREFEPTQHFQNYQYSLDINYERLANPNTFTGLKVNGNFFANTLKLDSFGFNFSLEPGKQYDYFEPRVDGRYFIYENTIDVGGFISSNYNRPFALDLRLNAGTFFEENRNTTSYRINIEPRFRFNDAFFMTYEFTVNETINDRGFATFFNNQPIFGERDRKIIENSINANYTFNPFNALKLQFRHYWDTVLYDINMYNLQANGRLIENPNLPKTDLASSPDINFSTWNIDLSYSWQFAPGSFLTALYRNQLFRNTNQAEADFNTSLDQLFQQNTQHTLSIRLQYFIDVSSLARRVFKSV
ncbi:MAG: DUF5916 domain-containing protein [Psychroflexus salarius]